jgi:TRAP-type C4-dicarboxylate transport system substrate-binding protein
MKSFDRFMTALLAAVMALALTGTSLAQTEVKRLRIVGGLAEINQYTRQEEPFWTRELPKLTGGRVTAEIVPFDRAGIRGQEMLRLMQLGVVPFGTALLSLTAAQEPSFAAPDLAGLSADMAVVRKSTAAFRHLRLPGAGHLLQQALLQPGRPRRAPHPHLQSAAG